MGGPLEQSHKWFLGVPSIPAEHQQVFRVPFSKEVLVGPDPTSRVRSEVDVAQLCLRGRSGVMVCLLLRG